MMRLSTARIRNSRPAALVSPCQPAARVALLVALAFGGAASFAPSDAPAAEPAEPQASGLVRAPSDPVAAAAVVRAAELIRELDDNQFRVRRDARDALQRMLVENGSSAAIARRLEDALLGESLPAATAVELQSLLESFTSRPPLPIDRDPSDEEISRLIRWLDDDAFAVRFAARNRLRRYAEELRVAIRLLAPLKTALSQPAANRETRETIAALYEAARSVWLLDDREDTRLPPVADQAIDGWIAALVPARGAAASSTGTVHLSPSETEPPEETVPRETPPGLATAERELLDALCRRDAAERVTTRLSAALADLPDVDGNALRVLYEWTRPAMVAEIWIQRNHNFIQFLYVNVPQKHSTVTGDRFTLFDRIDDQTAHCVSGVTLSRGDYPVDRAIPHPLGQPWMCCIRNLPTPRRRMAYEIRVARPESVRLQELSERTCDSILAAGRHLSWLEVLMLEQLDPRSVAKFAGTFFKAMPDQPCVAPPDSRGELSEHEAICSVLARSGVSAAQPALEQLATARGERAGAKQPYAVAACLAIAVRDPWPSADQWLADLMQKPLMFSDQGNAEVDLSATAAALLLARHQLVPEEFEIVNAGGLVIEQRSPNDGAPARPITFGYRFVNPSSREKALRWWEDKRKQHSSAPAG